jgi:acetyl esterase/lipase
MYLTRLARFLPILCLCFLPGCSRYQILNALVPRCGYQRTADIAYGTEPRQRLDVYQPETDTKRKTIVIFFYGGYWQYGKKDNYRFVGQALTSEGFIAILPDYRLYPAVTFPAFVQDGALTVKWAHDNARRLGGDPNRIFLMGHSAGAHIAAMLTLDPQYLRAVGLDRSNIRGTAGLSGPYDFDIGSLRPVFDLAPATRPYDRAVNVAAEPITFVDGREPPMLLLQGGTDTVVDPGNTLRLAARIRQLGGAVQVIIYPDEGHAQLALALAAPFRWIAPVLKDCTAFFRAR